MILVAPTTLGIRQTDSYGSGEYGASRSFGKRTHKGIDYVVVPHDEVTAPAGMEQIKVGMVYTTGQNRYTSLHFRLIEDPEYLLKLFYVQPLFDEIGTIYQQGEVVGMGQDLRLRYPADQYHDNPITPHVHMELWVLKTVGNRKRRRRIDPTPFLEGADGGCCQGNSEASS